MVDSAVIRVVIGLLLVVGAILACAWLARRSGLLSRGGAGLLRVVASQPLGPRAQVAVIEIENTWLVVGLTQNQMTLLHTLPAGAAPADAALPGFRGKLAAQLRRPGPPGS